MTLIASLRRTTSFDLSPEIAAQTPHSKVPEQLINKVSDVLTAMCCRNPGTKPPDSCFRAEAVPQISLKDYTDRIADYFQCSDATLVIALIYIHRFANKNPDFINEYTIHRLFLTAARVADKFINDTCCSNDSFARVAGIKTLKLNELEVTFLTSLDYKLCVDEHEYTNYYHQICPVNGGTAHSGRPQAFST